MRRGKAAGSDMIPGEVYKLVEHETVANSHLSKSMLSMLNNIYSKGAFPAEWKDCSVVPIFKKGDRLDPNNYRGIALINTLLKVLTKVLAARLQDACRTFNLLKREQVGFVRGEECVAQAACLLESCQRRRIRGKDTLLCFLDLRKAYDLVPHDRLISKLYKAGLGVRMTKFIEKMYENTYMRVRIGKSLTEAFKYERGVRQGCPTSPLLFDIYINDLLDGIRPVEVPGLEHGLRGLMFADDTVIIADDYQDLVEKLAAIERWMSMNAMEVNPSKCGVMVIKAKPSEAPIEPIMYNGEIIPIVEKYVYLGIEFNNILDINMMSKYRIDKSKQTLHQLSKTLANIRVPLGYRTMLIKSILVPTLNYGSEIFGMNEMRVNSLKRILDNAIKCILKKSNFCRFRAYEELDVKPLYLSGATARTRGLKKWTESAGLISDLIRSQSDFKSKQSTWIKASRRWLKLNKIDLSNSPQACIEQVAANRLERLRERDISVIGNFAKKYSLKSGKALIKAEILKRCNYIGLNGLIKMRTGTFSFTKDLVRTGLVPTIYRDKCICCRKTCIENVEHIILYCEAFNSVRERYIPNSKFKHRDSDEAMKTLKMLLGGEPLTSSGKITEGVLNNIEYLSVVLPLRSAIIAERKAS